MITVGVLGLDDHILPDDLVRDIDHSYDPSGDRNRCWIEAQKGLSGWVGKTLREYYAFGTLPRRRTGRLQVVRVPKHLREEGGFIVLKELQISLFP